jgi:hypothetical protein
MPLRKPRRLVKIREGPAAEADVLAADAAALAADAAALAAALAADAAALAVDAADGAEDVAAVMTGEIAATKSVSSRLIVVRR